MIETYLSSYEEFNLTATAQGHIRLSLGSIVYYMSADDAIDLSKLITKMAVKTAGIKPQNPLTENPMTLSVDEIKKLEATLPKTPIAPLPNNSMSIGRIQEINKLNITPEEALEYALITNNSDTIKGELQEHGLDKLFEPELEDHSPEDALEFAIDNIPNNILTTLLNAHGYQPIPKRKKALRETALLKPY